MKALPEAEKTIALLTEKILNEESKNEMLQPSSRGGILVAVELIVVLFLLKINNTKRKLVKK
jgi:hypothetical protein